MKLFKRHLRITIYPDLGKLFLQREENLGRKLTEEEKYDIQDLYPPVVINKYPDEFTVSCSIVRAVQPAHLATQLVLDVTNLSAFTRLHILNAQYKRICIEAGYLGKHWEYGDPIQDGDLDILFKGSIVWMGTTVEARRNIVTRFVGIAGNTEALSAYSNLMGLNYQAGYNLYQLVHEVYVNSDNPDIKLNLSDEDRNKLLQTTTGVIKPTDLGQVLKNQSIDMTYEWEGTGTIDSDVYINLNSKDNEGEVYPINETTGLIDMPSLQGERNIKFKMLLNSKMKILDYVRLNNYDIQLPTLDSTDEEDLKKANSGFYLDREGLYRITRISYALNTRGTSFVMDIEAVARDVYAQMTGK